MNKAIPDYYEALGLRPTATPDEIKKRYRELARRYHPDMNPHADAANKIKVINAAYHVLGDVDRKEAYDAERALRQAAQPQPARPAGTGSGATPTRASTRSGASGQTQSQTRVDFNGFGRTVARDTLKESREASAKREETARRRSTDAFGTVNRLLAEAHIAYTNHRYREAEDFCRQALMIDRSNAAVYELLGDIQVRRGQREGATTAYSYAIQLNPRNYNAQTKLERVLYGKAGAGERGPTMARGASMPNFQQVLAGPNRDKVLFMLNMGVFGAWIAILFLFVPNLGATIFVNPVLDAMVGLGLIGTTSGLLLAFNWRMRPISEELMLNVAQPTDVSRPFSLGTPLTLLAFVWFYLSLLGYLVVAAKRRNISLSVISVYVVAILYSLVLPWFPKATGDNGIAFWLLVCSGNILFPTMLLGWMCGDAVRLPRWTKSSPR